MSEMVEKAAKAMWAARRVHVGNVGVELEAWGDGSIPQANGIMDEARAAIEALREPTDWMSKAGRFYGGECYHDVWVSMIDAALEDK